jgi:hypothetical protein
LRSTAARDRTACRSSTTQCASGATDDGRDSPHPRAGRAFHAENACEHSGASNEVRHHASQSAAIASRQRNRRCGANHRFGFEFMFGLGGIMRDGLGHGFVFAQFVRNLVLAEFMLLLELQLVRFEFQFLLAQQLRQHAEALVGQRAKGSWQSTRHRLANDGRGDASDALQHWRGAPGEAGDAFESFAKKLFALLELTFTFELAFTLEFTFEFQFTLAESAEDIAEPGDNRAEELLALFELAFPFAFTLPFEFQFAFTFQFTLEFTFEFQFTFQFAFAFKLKFAFEFLF